MSTDTLTIDDSNVTAIQTALSEYYRQKGLTTIESLKERALEYGIEILTLTEISLGDSYRYEYVCNKRDRICNDEYCKMCIYKKELAENDENAGRYISYFEYEISMQYCNLYEYYTVECTYEDKTDLLRISQYLEELINYTDHDVNCRLEPVYYHTIYLLYRYTVLLSLDTNTMDEWQQILDKKYPPTDIDTIKILHCILVDSKRNLYLYTRGVLCTMSSGSWRRCTTYPDTLDVIAIQYVDESSRLYLPVDRI